MINNKLFTVFGSDTYIGAHMMKHLSERYQFVYGFSQDEEFCLDQQTIPIDKLNTFSEDIPTVEANWLVLCIDPSIGYEKYIAKVKKICDILMDSEFVGDICFFSSASICLSDHEALSEKAMLYPRTETDLAMANGENIMTFLSCSEKGYAVPHIMRVGVPFGNEIGMETLPGFVNHMDAAASRGTSLEIPMVGDTKRTLTHISDICDSVIELMNSDYCPLLVNIPGEIRTIHDVGIAISNKYSVEFAERGLNTHNEQDFYAGDQHLAEELFHETVKFNPKHTFAQWIGQKSSTEPRAN